MFAPTPIKPVAPVVPILGKAQSPSPPFHQGRVQGPTEGETGQGLFLVVHPHSVQGASRR